MSMLVELRTTLVSDGELEKAKRRYARDLEAGYDDVEGLCSWFGGTALFFANPRSPEQRFRRFVSTTAEQVRRVANQILRPERMAAVVVGNVDRSLSRKVERILSQALRL